MAKGNRSLTGWFPHGLYEMHKTSLTQNAFIQRESFLYHYWYSALGSLFTKHTVMLVLNGYFWLLADIL